MITFEHAYNLIKTRMFKHPNGTNVVQVKDAELAIKNLEHKYNQEVSNLLKVIEDYRRANAK